MVKTYSQVKDKLNYKYNIIENYQLKFVIMAWYLDLLFLNKVLDYSNFYNSKMLPVLGMFIFVWFSSSCHFYLYPGTCLAGEVIWVHLWINIRGVYTLNLGMWLCVCVDKDNIQYFHIILSWLRWKLSSFKLEGHLMVLYVVMVCSWYLK